MWNTVSETTITAAAFRCSMPRTGEKKLGALTSTLGIPVHVGVILRSVSVNGNCGCIVHCGG